MKLLVAVALLGTTTVFAKPIKPCDAREFQALQKAQRDGVRDGFKFSRYMKNGTGNVLGYYAWDASKTGVHAEICESVQASDDLTVSSEWYYWQSRNYTSDPSTWSVGVTYLLAQDEGLATLKLLKVNSDANVEAELSVIGWGGGGRNRTVRKEKVFFTK